MLKEGDKCPKCGDKLGGRMHETTTTAPIRVTVDPKTGVGNLHCDKCPYTERTAPN